MMKAEVVELRIGFNSALKGCAVAEAWQSPGKDSLLGFLF